MKTLLSSLFSGLVFGLLFMSTASAQIQAPAASPLSKVEQRVGLVDINLEYSRPGVKGRTVFGDLVPFGKMWRTGANQSTKITFSGDVKVNGNDVKAGTYALLTIPGKDEWTMILYSKSNFGGVPGDYSEENDAARFTAKAVQTGMNVETMTLVFRNITDNSADLSLLWENTMVTMEISMDTDAGVMASIENTMKGPSARDYYAAANYMASNDKDMKKAYKYINKAISMDYERYWTLRAKAQIEANMGNYADAVTTIKKSSEMAMAAGNEGYAKGNKGFMMKWKEMM